MTKVMDGRQLIRTREPLPWHQHDEGYAAIVLEGGYLEAGSTGRRRVAAGDVIIHPPFSGHADWFFGRPLEILNLPLPHTSALRLRSGRVTDPEDLVRRLHHGDEDVAVVLEKAVTPVAAECDLPDMLAAVLASGLAGTLEDWAIASGVAPRTLRRLFASAYGISPRAFRALSRSRQAWVETVTTRRPLVEIACDLGFADQAHMTRSVAKLTGRAPTVWRTCSGR